MRKRLTGGSDDRIIRLKVAAGAAKGKPPNEEAKMNNFVKYHTLNLPATNRRAGKTRGFVRMEALHGAPVHGQGNWRVYFAECSPRDRFNRKIARAIVDSRAAGENDRVLYAELSYQLGEGINLTVNILRSTSEVETRQLVLPDFLREKGGPKYPTNEMLQEAYRVLQESRR